MEGELRNAASERYRNLVARMNVEDIAVVFADAHADGFVREDRRRVIGLPTADRVEFLEQVRAWTHLDEGKPTFDVTEVAKVAGDRLVLCGVSISYGPCQPR